MSGKGDKQRPKTIPEKVLEDNWNNTFKVKQNVTPLPSGSNSEKSQKQDTFISLTTGDKSVILHTVTPRTTNNSFSNREATKNVDYV